MVVFPNYAAKVDHGSVLLELSHRLLCDPLAMDVSPVTIAAQVDTSSVGGAYRPLSNPRVSFVSLGLRRTGSRFLAKVFEYLRVIPRVRSVVLQTQFAYIFAPGNVGLVALLFCLITRRRYALYLRGEWSAGTPLVFRWAKSLVFRNAAFVLCTGSELASKTRTLNARSEAVIPMSELLAAGVASPKTRGAEDGRRLLFVGQLLVEKGVYELIDALKSARLSGLTNLKLTVVGTGIEEHRLKEYVQSEGLSDNVVFTGLVEDVAKLADLYRESDIFCLPTYHEGFPRVIYEAMWFRLAIITTQVGQIDSVLTDGVNCCFVNPRDPKDLARAMAILHTDRNLRTRLSEQARADVEPLTQMWRRANHGSQVLRWMRREALPTTE